MDKKEKIKQRLELIEHRQESILDKRFKRESFLKLQMPNLPYYEKAT